MKRFWFALNLLAAFCFSTAQAEWVRYENYKVQVQLPSQWKVQKDLYGVPIVVLGPERKGERAVLEIQHTPAKNYVFDHAQSADSQDTYFVGRKAWLSRYDGEFVSKIPYQKLSSAHHLDGSEIGYKYKLRGHQFEERSVQVNCDGSMYMIKSLVSDLSPNEDRVALGKMISQFQCASATAKDGKYVPTGITELQSFVRKENAATWPTQSDFKKSTVEQKGKALEALVEFYKRYDAAVGAEGYAFAEPDTQSAFARFRAKLSGFLTSAQADAVYNCFFGGWPSTFVTVGGRTTCQYPNDPNGGNDAYAKVTTQCKDKQLACNPALFGEGLPCVDVSTAELRSHMTLDCEINFEHANRKFEDIVKQPGFNNDLLQETMDSAKGVCTAGASYTSKNVGLCNTLANRLDNSLKLGLRPDTEKEVDKGFIDNLESLKTDEMAEAFKEVDAQWDQFEKECFDNATFLADKQGCPEQLDAVTKNLERIDKTSDHAAQQIAQGEKGEAPGGALNNSQCPDGKCNPSGGTEPVAQSGTCTLDQAKAVKKAEDDHKCGKGKYFSEGCLKHLTLSITNDLWSNVSGLFDLVGGNKVMRWLHIEKPEDDLASKAQQGSQTKDSFIARLRKNGILDTVHGLEQSIGMAVDKFINEDAFCQHWTGTPHFSKCDVPSAGQKCTACDKWAEGRCSVAGYVVGELLPFIISGGMSGTVSAANDAARLTEEAGEISKLLSKSDKASGLLHATEDFAKEVPEVGKATAEAAAHGAGEVGSKAEKSTSLMEKLGITRRAANGLQNVKKVYDVIGKFKNNFLSKIFGKLKPTLAKLQELRKSAKVVALLDEGKTGKIWSGTKFIARLPLLPYKAASRLGFVSAQFITDRLVLNEMRAAAKLAEGDKLLSAADKAALAATGVDEASRAGEAGQAVAAADANANQAAHADEHMAGESDRRSSGWRCSRCSGDNACSGEYRCSAC